MTYQSALNAVLRGQIIGWQDDNRRWWVDAADLNRFVKERQAALSVDRTAPR